MRNIIIIIILSLLLEDENVVKECISARSDSIFYLRVAAAVPLGATWILKDSVRVVVASR